MFTPLLPASSEHAEPWTEESRSPVCNVQAGSRPGDRKRAYWAAATAAFLHLALIAAVDLELSFLTRPKMQLVEESIPVEVVVEATSGSESGPRPQTMPIVPIARQRPGPILSPNDRPDEVLARAKLADSADAIAPPPPRAVDPTSVGAAMGPTLDGAAQVDAQQPSAPASQPVSALPEAALPASDQLGAAALARTVEHVRASEAAPAQVSPASPSSGPPPALAGGSVLAPSAQIAAAASLMGLEPALPPTIAPVGPGVATLPAPDPHSPGPSSDIPRQLTALSDTGQQALSRPSSPPDTSQAPAADETLAPAPLATEPTFAKETPSVSRQPIATPGDIAAALPSPPEEARSSAERPAFSSAASSVAASSEADLQPSDPHAELRRALSGLECARVSAAFDVLAGSVVLTGHARSDDDRRVVAKRAASLTGVQHVDASGLVVMGDPYCRVLGFLDRPELQKSKDQRHDLLSAAGTNRPEVLTLEGGKPLTLTIGAPEFDSYLYVDYFSNDGTVTHLLPTDRLDNILEANAAFNLGAGGRGRRPVAYPPYGLDMVVVLAASKQIIGQPRPVQEEAASYLGALSERIQALHAAGVRVKYEYAYYLVATEAPRISR